MGNPFTPTTVSSYNANPPPDDGSQVATNIVAWSTIKTKLPDPIKSAFDTSETATNNAFAKVFGGGGFTTTAISYGVLAADQGKFVKATASGITITTPDATVVNAPFLFAVVNESTGDITLAGNNPGVQQTVDGSNTITIPSFCGCLVNTDGSNWFTDGQNFNKTQIVPQGRLTLVSATPVIVSDQAAKTAIYYTPHVGDLIPIPNGSVFRVKEFSELTLTINSSNYLANELFDVFVALDPADNSTVVIGTGPTWATSTAGSGARGTGAGTTELVRLKGLWTNKVSMTLRNNVTTYAIAASSATYVGSIFIDGTNGQVSCYVGYGQGRKFGVWNAYNRVPIMLKAGDGTASWTVSTTWRPANNAAGNSISIFTGLADEPFDLEYRQYATNVGNAATGNAGIGWNSTSAPSGRIGQSILAGTIGFSSSWDLQARYIAPPSLGTNIITALEQIASNNMTFSGTESFMLLSAIYRG